MNNNYGLISSIKKDGLSKSIPGFASTIPGVVDLANSMSSSFDTSSISAQKTNINDINRMDVLNGNASVDSNKKNALQIGSESLNAALTGMQVAGPWGALAGIAPILGGIFGNAEKDRVANIVENQNSLNLDAKNRQFNYQDLKSNMANFAAYGGNFSNPLTEFNSGGTHEENPNNGIMQGVGANGKQNLVEEGETKNGTYVYSDRLIIDEKMAIENNLPKKVIGKSFADASKELTKEAKEKPNDPISKKTTEAYLSKLTQVQEMLKEKIETENKNKKFDENMNSNIMSMGLGDGLFAKGGEIHIKKSSVNKFSSMASELNMSNDEYAEHILNTSKDPKLIKQANFMLNASKWNALGGELFSNGGDLTRYFNDINQGAQVYADGGNLYGLAGDIKNIPVNLNTIKPGVIDTSSLIKSTYQDLISNDNQNINTENKVDYSRYAPVIANAFTGIKDIFDVSEKVQYNRYNPEKLTNKFRYQPIDTGFVTRPIIETANRYADEISNVSGGNRAAALASLISMNRHNAEAISDAEIKAQDINYNRRNQIDQLNLGVDQINAQELNRANLYNSEIANREKDSNAANRAAKRNASRQAVLQSATDLGMIGRENWAAKTGAQMYGYSIDPTTGTISYGDGTKYKKDPKTGNLIKIN